jgi:hypothetical protein
MATCKAHGIKPCRRGIGLLAGTTNKRPRGRGRMSPVHLIHIEVEGNKKNPQFSEDCPYDLEFCDMH